jgi:hypothetical protein
VPGTSFGCGVEAGVEIQLTTGPAPAAARGSLLNRGNGAGSEFQGGEGLDGGVDVVGEQDPVLLPVGCLDGPRRDIEFAALLPASRSYDFWTGGSVPDSMTIVLT